MSTDQKIIKNKVGLLKLAETSFQRTFPSEQKAFYFWYSRFDPQTGKLRHFPPE